MEGGLRSCSRGPGRAIVGAGITFTEVVGLELVGEATEDLLQVEFVSSSVVIVWGGGGYRWMTYPVNLVEIVRLHHQAADNSSARRRLHLNRDLSIENVEAGPNGGVFTLLVDGELGTVRTNVDIAVKGVPITQRTLVSEVVVNGRSSQAFVGGARRVKWVTLGRGLGQRKAGHKERHEHKQSAHLD